jgi:Zn-dependent protease
MNSQSFLYQLLTFYPVFLFALTIHEVAHALTAKWAGDTTAAYQNRLSLNPVVHMDPFGTVLLPILMLTLPGAFLFGWARPVPVVEARFRTPAWSVVVSLAGPFSNVLLAIFGTLVLSLLLRVGLVGHQAGWWTMSESFVRIIHDLTLKYVYLNWLLAFFNLVPVPPLDGSHVLHHFVIRGRQQFYAFWEFYSRFGFIFFLLLLFNFGTFLWVPVRFCTHLTLSLLGFPSTIQL